MAFIQSLLSKFNVNYERLSDGSHHYSHANSASWLSLEDKLKTGYTNPVLLPILQLISHYVSKAEFFIQSSDGTLHKDHELIKLINNPNLYQSKQDLLSQFVWFKYCLGYTYIYPASPVGFNSVKDVTALYNLDVSKVLFPKDFQTPFVFSNTEADNVKNSVFTYDKEGLDLTIATQRIIPFFDLPNGIADSNMLVSPSRLDSLVKPLSNISAAFEAKNIVIGSNGKELFTNQTNVGGQAFPIQVGEKQDIQNKFNFKFGLGLGRSRSVISNANIKWQSLHINLADLGLDESVIKDAQMIVKAFNIPNELISFDGKGAKYENQIQATIGFIQSVAQDVVDDIANSITSYFKLENETLIASFDHLPIMQTVENKKADTVKKKADALKALLDAGITEDDALNALNMNDMNFKTKPNEEG